MLANPLATRFFLVLTSFFGMAVGPDGVVHAQTVIAGTSGSPPTLQDSFVGLLPGSEFAFSFSAPAGGPYDIASLQIAAFHYDGVPGETATFTIYADSSGMPGNALATFVASSLPSFPAADPPSTAPVTQLTPSAPLALAAGAYWLGGSTTEQQVNWVHGLNAFGTTASRASGGAWNVDPGNNGNVPAFALLGSAVPEPTAEALCAALLAVAGGVRRASKRG